MLNDFTGADKVYIACGYTDMIYYYLVKNGTDLHRSMTSEEFHDHIQKQYDNVMDGVY